MSSVNASDILIERLRALITKQGETPYSVSQKLGWARGQCAAKVLAPRHRPDGSPNPNHRPTTLAEVDQILAVLGLDAEALLPVK